MQNITDDRKAQVRDIAFVLADGIHVQHRLGRVSVTAIARINDVYMWWYVPGDQVRGTACVVTHHEDVGIHRLECPNRIQNSLSFAGRHSRRIKVDDGGAQAFTCDLEGGTGAGAVFKEEIHNRVAFKQRSLFFLSLSVGSYESARRVEQSQ